MDKRIERFIINKYIDMEKLLKSIGVDIAPNATLFCPFHPNVHTKSASYYGDDELGPCIFCYAEHKLYTNYDVYKILIPEVDTTQLAQALWDRMTKDQQDFVNSNFDQERDLPELPYIESLRKFKKNELSFRELLKDINMSIEMDEQLRTIQDVYNLPNIQLPTTSNKYIYYINNNESQYKIISSIQALRLTNIPEFLRLYLQRNGDCIMIPNKINDIVYSLTFRTLGDRKQFLKYGNVTHFLYNLGNLPDDFTYGTPLILLEGNLDCDVMKNIYPYTVASLTSDLSTNQVQLISHLTDKVIVAYDNDESGISGYYRVRNKLQSVNVRTTKFNHYNKLHDLGDLIDLKIKDEDEYNYIVRSYKNQIYSML